MEEDLRLLINSLRNLTKNIEDSNSLGRNFWRGAIFGLGSAIGATVIAAAVAGTIIGTFDSIKNLPFFR